MSNLKYLCLLCSISFSVALADSPFFQSSQSNKASTSSVSPEEFKKRAELLSQQNQVQLNKQVSNILSAPPIPALPLPENEVVPLTKAPNAAPQNNAAQETKTTTAPPKKTLPSTTPTPLAAPAVTSPATTNDIYTGFQAQNPAGAPANPSHNQTSSQWNINY